MTEQEEKRETRIDWIIGIGIFSIVVALWLGSWKYVYIHYGTEDGVGWFGDQFGAVNSLFSGLALAGIIYTIILQKKELKHQREELRLTREEFKTQNETMKIQRVDNTFFNLVRLIDEERESHFRNTLGIFPSDTPESLQAFFSKNANRATIDKINDRARSKFPNALNFCDKIIDCIRLIMTLPKDDQVFYLNLLSTSLYLDEKLNIKHLVNYRYPRSQDITKYHLDNLIPD